MADERDHLTNRLLATLPDDDMARLEPHLQDIEMPRGRVLYEPEATLDTVYFPHDSVISIVALMQDGRIAEMGTIGREGVGGFAWPAGAGRSQGRSIIQLPGKGSRMPLERLHEVLKDSEASRNLFLRYSEAFLRETMQLAACNALHSVEARACRWLLMTQDRVGSPELRLTQEFLSEMLGVQRTTVSLVTGNLERAGLVETRRSLIGVKDRPGLHRLACECYDIIERSFDELLYRTS